MAKETSKKGATGTNSAKAKAEKAGAEIAEKETVGTETAGTEPTAQKQPMPLFYESVVLLNKATHGDLKINPARDYGYAAGANSIVLAASEFPQAAAHYPIVFGKAGEELMAFAVTGHADGKNVFVDDKGKWREGTYIPAYVRRYPFMLVRSADGENYSLAVDAKSSLLNEKDGNAIYDNGEPSDTARNALAFCASFRKEMERTAEMLKELEDSGVLVERSAEVTLAGQKSSRIVGFLVVDERKLGELEDEKFLKLRKNGLLTLIYCHLWSMRGWNNLLD